MPNLAQGKHLIPFYPLLQMVRAFVYYKTVSSSRVYLLGIWLVKTIVLEPFRLVDTIVNLLLPAKPIRPIFIVGYYRSGTTYLQELLSTPQGFKTMTIFDSIFPEVCLTFSWLFQPIFTSLTRATGMQNQYHSIPFSWKFPGEEDVAINALGSFVDYNKIYQYPSHYKSISDRFLRFPNSRDISNWEADYLFIVKKISYKAGSRQLVLKSPPNLARIDLLKRLFPNARFVYIHRDPFDAIISTKRLWTLNAPYSFEKYSMDEIEPIIINQFERFHRHFMDNTYHLMDSSISFDELAHCPEASIKRVIKDLCISLDEHDHERIRRLVEKRSKPARHYPDPPVTLRNNTYLQELRTKLGYVNGAMESLT